MGPNSQKRLVDSLNLPPEERVLILCARLHLSQDQIDELSSILVGPLDWDRVMYKSYGHKLTALLYRHLKDPENGEAVPTSVMAQLRATYLGNVAKNLCFQTELRSALDALRAQNIPVIVLKGAALAGSVYVDVGLRPMVDMDLLVPEECVFTAQAIVQGLGYKPVGTRAEQEDFEQNHRHLPLLRGVRKPVAFEIHRHVMRRDSELYFDITGFWSRAQQVLVAGTKAWGLAPEDLLIHLSINFVLDRRFGSLMSLGQLCDIAETTRVYGDIIDWTELIREVSHSNLATPVFVGLYIAQQVLGAQVPEYALRRLEPVDLDSEIVKRLARQRVVGELRIGKKLVSRDSHQNWRTISLAMIKRLFPGKGYLSTVYNVPVQSRGVYHLYLRRLTRAFILGARLAAKLRQTRDDFAVDRWLHSIYRFNENRPHRENDQASPTTLGSRGIFPYQTNEKQVDFQSDFHGD